MIVTLTNLANVTIPLMVIDGNGNAVSYGLMPGASGVSLTMPDSQQNELIGLSRRGFLTYSYTQLPNQNPVFASGSVGRREITGATYTIQATDNGCVLDFFVACTLTLPSNIARGFSCSLLQAGTGKVTLAVGTGAILRIPGTATGTNGQWTVASLFVRDNTGSTANEWVASGNIA